MPGTLCTNFGHSVLNYPTSCYLLGVMLCTRPLLSPWILTSPCSGSNTLYWATLPPHGCHSHWAWAVIHYSGSLQSAPLCWYLSCSALANSFWTKLPGRKRRWEWKKERGGKGEEKKERGRKRGESKDWKWILTELTQTKPQTPGHHSYFPFVFRGIHSLNNLNILPTFQYSVSSSGYWKGLFSANSCSVWYHQGPPVYL